MTQFLSLCVYKLGTVVLLVLSTFTGQSFFESLKWFLVVCLKKEELAILLEVKNIIS